MNIYRSLKVIGKIFWGFFSECFSCYACLEEFKTTSDTSSIFGRRNISEILWIQYKQPFAKEPTQGICEVKLSLTLEVDWSSSLQSNMRIFFFFLELETTAVKELLTVV